MGGTAPPSSVASGITGDWSGTYQSTNSSASGTFSLKWQLQGSQSLVGTITITGTPCVTAGSITGTLSGDVINFGAVQAGQTISYQGTLSGTTMSGTYSAPSCGHGVGTWAAHKI